MELNVGTVISVGVVAVAAAGLYWRQTHLPPAIDYSHEYVNAPAGPGFPKVTASSAEAKKKKDQAEFENALKLADKPNPLAEVPAEEKSEPNKSAGTGEAVAQTADGSVSAAVQKKEGGIFLSPEMDSISFGPSSTTASPAPADGGVKPASKAATASKNTFPAGGSRSSSSSASSGGGSSTSGGPDLPNFAPAVTPTPVAGQALASDGSKASATPKPDPRIPASPFNRDGGRTPATTANPSQADSPPSPVKNPNSPEGRQ